MISITVRDINGKRDTVYRRFQSEIIDAIKEDISDDDEILLVMQDGTCIYSALGSDHPITKDDLTGFFA